MKKIAILACLGLLTLGLSSCSSDSLKINETLAYKNAKVVLDAQWSQDEALSFSTGFPSYVNEDKCILIDKIDNSGREIDSESPSSLSDASITEGLLYGMKYGVRGFEFKSVDSHQNVDMYTTVTTKYPFAFIEGDSVSMESVRAFRYVEESKVFYKLVYIDIRCPIQHGVDEALFGSFSFTY